MTGIASFVAEHGKAVTMQTNAKRNVFMEEVGLNLETAFELRRIQETKDAGKVMDFDRFTCKVKDF